MLKEKARLVIASTTSTQNSGLFHILIPAYEKTTKYGVRVEIIAVGTGKAIRIAKKERRICSSCMTRSGSRNLSPKAME